MTDPSADITGIGWISSAGLLRGKDIRTNAIRKVFSDARASEKLPDIPADASYPSSRRMDIYSRMGMAAIALALEDAGLDAWTEKRHIGMITSTEYGCLNTDFDYFDTVLRDKGVGASPGLFSYTLPSSFMGDAAIRFGLTGPTFAINEKTAFSPTCLKLALTAIMGGETDKMLCGVCHPVPPPVFKEINRMPAGALFLAIEKLPTRGVSYGRLILDKTGSMSLHGNEIQDLIALVLKCIARYG